MDQKIKLFQKLIALGLANEIVMEIVTFVDVMLLTQAQGEK